MRDQRHTDDFAKLPNPLQSLKAREASCLKASEGP